MKPLTNGLCAELRHRVQRRDLASEWRNEFPVLATPILLWLSELACMQAVAECLAADQITLGLAHNSKHLGASFEGSEIVITAVLTVFSDKTLDFDVKAHDQSRLVLDGTHRRALLTRERFEQKLAALRSGS